MKDTQTYNTVIVQTYLSGGGRWKTQRNRLERIAGPGGLKEGDTFQTEEDKVAGVTGNRFSQRHEVLA